MRHRICLKSGPTNMCFCASPPATSPATSTKMFQESADGFVWQCPGEIWYLGMVHNHSTPIISIFWGNKHPRKNSYTHGCTIRVPGFWPKKHLITGTVAISMKVMERLDGQQSTSTRATDAPAVAAGVGASKRGSQQRSPQKGCPRGWAPVMFVGLLINPMNTIVISAINHSEMGNHSFFRKPPFYITLIVSTRNTLW